MVQKFNKIAKCEVRYKGYFHVGTGTVCTVH